MNLLIRAALSVGFLLSSVGSADACCLWPFGGWWGAGYGGAPSYGYYGAGYTPWASPGYGGVYSAGYGSVYSAGYGSVYSAGYVGSANCCVPSCCDPCASGACASGACGGVTDTGTGTGSLKPANDPNFKDGTQKENYERNRDPAPAKDSLDDPLGFEAPRRPRPTLPDPDPGDDFSAPLPRGSGAPATRELDLPSTGGTGTRPGSDIPFGLDDDQISKKPPMPEANELPAVEPGDGSTFLEEEKDLLERQTRTMKPRNGLAERSSSLSEVLAPGRMASRSLPSTGSSKTASWAGQSNGDKRPSGTPVRWISVPAPEGHARL